MEKLVKFRLQTQKNSQRLCQKMTQIVKNKTHCRIQILFKKD
jgi:hypothetical protein